jgi:hypothetical protein
MDDIYDINFQSNNKFCKIRIDYDVFLQLVFNGKTCYLRCEAYIKDENYYN